MKKLSLVNHTAFMVYSNVILTFRSQNHEDILYGPTTLVVLLPL